MKCNTAGVDDPRCRGCDEKECCIGSGGGGVPAQWGLFGNGDCGAYRENGQQKLNIICILHIVWNAH